MSIFKSKPLPYDLSNFTVLVVEDSEHMQHLITQMLKVFGVGEILACSDANEAIELLTILQASKKSKYLTNIDIVLTDWLMPKGSGEDLLKWMRGHQRDSIRFLPVIVVSGYTTAYIAARARDLGANDTLVKPISGNGLAGRICSVIDHPRAFISAPSYFGPDRRRHAAEFSGMDRRVTQAVEVKMLKGKPE
jgi:two-component system, chemotaxis family, chemotaxis protein CheY